MSNNFNPLKDIFSNFDLHKVQDDTINLFSTIARESERNISAFVDCLQDTIQSNINLDIKTSNSSDSSSTNVEGVNVFSNYECPIPQRSNPITMEDMFNFSNSADSSIISNEVLDNDIIDIEINKESNNEDIDTMNNSNPIDPFSPIEEESTIDTSTTDISNNEVDLKKSFDVIDPFSSPVEDKSTTKNSESTNKPLTDREVINKTSSMWKYNPIADSLEVYPEYITSTESTPYAKIIASRVRGKKHKYNSTNCDDYFKYSVVGNCCIVGVSDGAGSKVYSRIGAKEVTTSYVRTMSSAVENLLKDSSFLEGLSYPVTDALFNKSCSKVALELQNSVKSSYSALVSKFEDISKNENYSKPLGRELSINDLSCTLLSAIIIPLETSNGVETFVATLQIGDGLICSIDSSKSFGTASKILGISDSGNFSGETEFITANGMMEQSNLMRRIKVMKGKTSAIILTTDGVADDYFPNESKSCNLYNDLILNGIIRLNLKQDNSIKLVPPIREQKTIEKNPKDVCVAYCEDIQDFFKISDETLWNDKSYIENAVSVYSQLLDNNESKNLENWLDNYTKRGSFDDRTLFLYQNISKDTPTS